MEIEEEIYLEDDEDFLNTLEFGFPKKIYKRSDYFHTMDDMSFYRRFRLTKPVAFKVLEEIEDQLEFPSDVNNSVSPINQLLTTLRFYACDAHQNCIADFIGVHQTTVSRVVRKVTNILANLRPKYISMCNNVDSIHVQNDFYNVAAFPKVVGCLDGTHIKIQSPGGEDAEIFRNRKGYFSINTQIVCDSALKIRDIVANWPGSAHDVTIFNNSRLKARFEIGEFPNSILLGDSGYGLKSYLLTPLLNPNTRNERLYNESHIRTRNTVERCIGVWKRRFPTLAYGLRCNWQVSLNIIVATAVLHNIAIEMNEEEPPPSDFLTEEELDYLIEAGNIPAVPLAAGDNQLDINYRTLLINNYFQNL